MKVEKPSIMSDKKTGGFWDLYLMGMGYKSHYYRWLVDTPLMVFFVWIIFDLIDLIGGSNPLVHHPYIFFATIMVVILVSEGMTFVARKYDHIRDKYFPEAYLRVQSYLLSGIMCTTIFMYFSLVAGVRTYGAPILGVKPIIFWGICYTVFFIIITSVTALIRERALKKRKLNTPSI